MIVGKDCLYGEMFGEWALQCLDELVFMLVTLMGLFEREIIALTVYMDRVH